MVELLGRVAGADVSDHLTTAKEVETVMGR